MLKKLTFSWFHLYINIPISSKINSFTFKNHSWNLWKILIWQCCILCLGENYCVTKVLILDWRWWKLLSFFWGLESKHTCAIRCFQKVNTSEVGFDISCHLLSNNLLVSGLDIIRLLHHIAITCWYRKHGLSKNCLCRVSE